MPTDHTAARIAEELDAMHRTAMEHYRDRNVSAYMSLFAPDLKYQQFNGSEIDKKQLTRDVERQLSRAIVSESSYTRESLTVDGDYATEQLVQVASATLRVFLLFHRTWRVCRTGRFTWVRREDGWKIQKVEVLDERLTAGAA